MKSSTTEPPTTIGAALGGGFYAGQFLLDGHHYALIVAPKTEGEHKPSIWIPNDKDAPDAKSYNDGFANTEAMAKAGSKLAKWARSLYVSGNDDWYLPSQDELEIIYRNLKPSTRDNYCYARSGINLSAAEPTRPYTTATPKQTEVELFITGAAEAFDDAWYWSSTLHASDSDCAWCQGFTGGYQDYYNTYDKLRARAVRRLAIQ